MPGEDAAVQHRREQVLRGVRALGVREPRQPSHAGATGLVPADVGPSVEVRRCVADMDDREHSEAGRRGPHRIPRRDDRVRPRPAGGPLPYKGRRPVRRAREHVRARQSRPPGHSDRATATAWRRSDSSASCSARKSLHRRAPGAVVAEVLEHLPPTTGVDQAVVDADAIHPVDALRGRRVVHRMQHRRPTRPLGDLDQPREELTRRRSLGRPATTTTGRQRPRARSARDGHRGTDRATAQAGTHPWRSDRPPSASRRQ